MNGLGKFLRKNLASVIVLVALVLIAGIALMTKFSVNADIAVANLGAEVNYADEDKSVIEAGTPIVADETLDQAIGIADKASTSLTKTPAPCGRPEGCGDPTVTASITADIACVAGETCANPSVTPSITSTTACLLPEGCGPTTVYKQGLKGTYFKKKDLTLPVFARLDTTINFSWGNQSPGTNVPVNNFSTRWTGFVTPKYSETYTFKVQHNDGVRLYVDNKTIIDKWTNNSTTTLSSDIGTIELQANQKYSIRLEYYDNVTSAGVKLRWKSISQAEQVIPKEQLSTAYNPNPTNGTGNGVIGTYFNGLNFAKRIIAERDGTVNFNWGTGSPASKVQTNNFSVVWTGKIQPKFSEAYTFYDKSSDGVRLWINGVKVIDKWVDQNIATENKGAIRLVAGQKYNIRLQYYEKTNKASNVLMWSSPSQRKQIVPKTQLYSGAIVNPTPTATPTRTVTSTATVTTTATASSTVTPVGDKLTIKQGFNTVVVGAGKGFIETSVFTSKGMKVFAFNRDGKYYTHPTSSVNWETNLKFMYPEIGYYVYNPGAQVVVTVPNVITTQEVKYNNYMTTGWNLLSIPTSSLPTGITSVKLDTVKRYFSSGCSITSAGVESCTTKGELKSIKELINSTKGYATIPVIVDGNTADATKAFDYVTVTSANIDTVTIPVGKAFWFFIFQTPVPTAGNTGTCTTDSAGRTICS